MEIPMGRTMPYNLEAEQAVLGSTIGNEKALGTVMESVQVEDFYTTAHRTIFNAVCDLYQVGTTVDIVTLSNALGEKIEAVGGIGYITRMIQSVMTTVNLKNYIEILKEKSMLRRLIEAAGEIIDMSSKEEQSCAEILEQSEQLIFNILENRETKNLYPIGDVVKSSIALLEELRTRGETVTGIPTGFTGLDDATAGLQKSDLIIIAARPGMGKTSLALNMAEHAAIRHHKTVAIFSLEMSKEQLVNRVLSSEAMVESSKMRNGSLDSNDMTKLAHSLRDVVSAPIYIDDTPGITVSEIRAKCRRQKLEKGLDMVVIDYLQLMQGRGRSDNRAQEVSEISRSLKIMAKELNVPVITLSQLNRDSEKGKRVPQLSDLRESGSIEQDADIVLMIHNPVGEEEEGAQPNCLRDCIIAKHRAGECRTIPIAWRGEYTKFTNTDNRN